MGVVKKNTEDGLPIFGQEPETTEDGLPVLKKKGQSGSAVKDALKEAGNLFLGAGKDLLTAITNPKKQPTSKPRVEVKPIEVISDYNRQFENITGHKTFSLSEPIKPEGLLGQQSYEQKKKKFEEKKYGEYRDIEENEIKPVMGAVEMGITTPQQLSELYNKPYGQKLVGEAIQANAPETGSLALKKGDFGADEKWKNIANAINTKNRPKGVEIQNQELFNLDVNLSNDLRGAELSRVEIEPGTRGQETRKVTFSIPEINTASMDELRETADRIKEYTNLKTKDGIELDKEEILKNIQKRMFFLSAEEPMNPEINAISGQTGQAIVKVNAARERGEYDLKGDIGRNDPINQKHFELGLNYIKSANPAQYKNIVRGITERGIIAGVDFEQLGSIGQQINNQQLFREGAVNPQAIGKETELDYQSYDTKRSFYSYVLSEELYKMGYRNMAKVPQSAIDKAWAKHPELENKKIVGDIKLDEANGGSGIVKGGWLTEIMNGIADPIKSLNLTFNTIFESPVDNYLNSKRLDYGNQKVKDKNGNYVDYLPSQANLFNKALRGAGQFASQLGLAYTLGGILNAPLRFGTSFVPRGAMTAGQAGNITAYGAGGLSALGQEYGHDYIDFLQKTGDPNKATLMATVSSLGKAVIEVGVLNDVKLAEQFKGAIKNQTQKLATGIADLVSKGASKEAASSFIKQWGKNTAKILFKEGVFEEVGQNHWNFLTESFFSPKTAKDRDILQESVDVAKEGIVAFSLPAMIGAFGSSKVAQKITKDALHSGAINFQSYKDLFDKALINGSISEQEHTDVLKALESHRESINNAPKRDVEGNVVSADRQLEYAYQNTISKTNKEKADAQTDPVKKKYYADKAKAADEIKEAIFNPTVNADRVGEIDKELESLNKNRELDNKEIDIKLKELDKESSTYKVQKERLEQKRKDNEDSYEAKIKKLNDEKSKLTPPAEEKEVEVKDERSVLQKAVDDGKIKGVYADLINQGEGGQVLQDIAQQAQNLGADGKPRNDGLDAQARKATVDQFGEEVVNEAIQKYPAQDKPHSEKVITPEGIATPITETNVDDISTFENRYLEDFNIVEDSSFDWRVTSSLSTKDRKKAVQDIRDGKDTAAARKLKAEIKEAHERGTIVINRGRGNNAETTEVPINEWFSLDTNEQEAADKMADETANIINENDITLQNINDVEHLFNGFPYTKEDLAAVKAYLEGQSKGNEQTLPIGESSPSSAEETITDETTTPQQEPSKVKDEIYDTPLLKSKASDFEVLYVPRSIQEEAYKNDKVNQNREGGAQTIDRIIQRGGYSIEELDKLLPNWRNLLPSTQQKNEQATPINEGNKENQQSNIPSSQETTTTETVDTKEQEPAVGKFEQKARKLADKINKAELPSWLKADLPEGTKGAGATADQLKKALADAVIKMGQLLDKGVEFSKAVKEAVKELVNLQGEENRDDIEKGFEDYYNKQGQQPPPPKPPKEDTEQKDSGGLNEKGILSHLHNAEKVPEAAKKGFEAEGLEYETKSQKEAEEVAKGVIAEFGIDEAVRLAEQQKFDGDVNSLIFGEALNQLAEQEQNAKTEEEKLAAAQKFAEVGITYDKMARYGGRFNAAINYFYKRSPLGIAMMENAKRAEDFKQWSKPKEKSWKEFFGEMLKDPELREILKEEVAALSKNEKSVNRMKRRKAISDAFDKAKIDTKGGLQSSIIPPQIWNGAVEIMKQAFLAGESLVDTIQKGVDHIKKNHKENWDEDKFWNEWTDKLLPLEADQPKSRLTILKENIKNQIDKLNEQIRNKQRIRGNDKVELDKEAKDLIKQRDDLKKKLEEVAPLSEDKWYEKRLKYLDKFREKLKGLTEKEKDEVIQKAHRELLENGALEYDDFKKIIAKATGMAELTPEQVKRMKELVEQTNAVEKKAEELREKRTPEAYKEYREAQKVAGKATKELNDIFHTKPDIVKRLTSVMQLSTLGTVALITNVVYNVVNQVSLRLPIGIFNTLFDVAKSGAGRLMGKNIEREYNIIDGQIRFWKNFGVGAKEAVEQVVTGLNRMDYTQKEIHEQPIRPFRAWSDLIASARGKKKLTHRQWWDKAIQAVPGIYAEAVARALNVGDKPQRFAAEGMQAGAFASAMGIKDNFDRKMFALFPREEAYKVYKAKGLSDADAANKADYIYESIIKEGQRSTFQQDNWFTNKLNLLFGGGKSGVGELTKALTVSPYIKIPSNAFWSFYNLINPEIAVIQVGVHAARAKVLKNKGEDVKAELAQREARYWMAHAVLGMATRTVILQMVKAGFFIPSPDDDDPKKEKEAVSLYDRGGTTKIGGMNVSNKYLGAWGMIGNAIAQKDRDMTPEQRENQETFWRTILGGMELDALAELENGVLANTSSLVQFVTSGNPDRYLMNTINLMTNIINPATLAQINRASIDKVTDAKGDTFWQKLNQNFAQRSTLYRRVFDVQLHNKRSMWGEPIQRSGNWLGRMFGITPEPSGLFGKPLYDDFVRTSDPAFIPSVPLQTLGDQKLNTHQYDRLQEYVGNERKLRVEPFINDASTIPGFNVRYSQLNDTDKKFVLNYLYSWGREEGLKKFYSDFPELKKVEPEKDYLKDIQQDLFKILIKYQ